jgi:type IV secretion system protein VirB10
MTSAKAPRKDLVTILITALMIVMLGVIGYRMVTGSTNADKMREKNEAEERKKIVESKPGDAVSFQNRLAAELEEERIREAQRNALPAYPVVQKTELETAASRAAKAEADRIERERMAKLEAARIEEEKRELAIRASKMNAFEESNLGNMGAAGNPNAAGISPTLLALLSNGQGAGAPNGPSAPAMPALAGGVPPGMPGGAGAPSGPLAQLLGLGGGNNSSGSAQDASSRSWEASQVAGSAVTPLTPTPVTSPYILHEGSTIPAILLSAVESDLPGDLRAQVTRDVFDSVTMRHLIIPQGTVLRGAYNSEVVPGQERLLFGFSRMIFPNGASVSLSDTAGRSNFRGSDRQGRSGLEAEVNSHFWKIFGPALVIGAVTNFTRPRDAGLSISFSGAASETASSALTETARRILGRNQNIKPTLSLQPGERFNLVVARDMLLPPEITTTAP